MIWGGHNFRGILSSAKGTEEGGMELTLLRTKKQSNGSVTLNNSGSRFLGPHQISMSYADSFLPLQKTNISLLNSIPVDELNYISGQHEIALFPDISADFSGSIIKAQPGFNLKSLEIESDAIFLSAGINYQWIRQRQENLSQICY
jgi:hemolysin activation/secretion protein